MRFVGHTESPPGIKPALFTGIVDDIICHPLGQGNQCYMEVRIDGVDVLQGVVQEIHIGDRVVTLSPGIVQSLLTCRPLAAKPRLKLITPRLPLLLNFFMTTFEIVRLSNPFHINNPWSS